MNLIRRILAGIDFSAGAGHAAGRAAFVSEETGAVLELFHSTNLSGLDKLRRLVPGVPGAWSSSLSTPGANNWPGWAGS